jgi:hypothetical protein
MAAVDLVASCEVLVKPDSEPYLAKQAWAGSGMGEIVVAMQATAGAGLLANVRF